MKAMIGLAPATTPSAIQAPRITQTSKTRWNPYASRARSVSAARESTGNAVPTTRDGIATKASTTRNEALKYPVCSAVAISDIITIATR